MHSTRSVRYLRVVALLDSGRWRSPGPYEPKGRDGQRTLDPQTQRRHLRWCDRCSQQRVAHTATVARLRSICTKPPEKPNPHRRMTGRTRAGRGHDGQANHASSTGSQEERPFAGTRRPPGSPAGLCADGRRRLYCATARPQMLAPHVYVTTFNTGLSVQPAPTPSDTGGGWGLCRRDGGVNVLHLATTRPRRGGRQ